MDENVLKAMLEINDGNLGVFLGAVGRLINQQLDGETKKIVPEPDCEVVKEVELTDEEIAQYGPEYDFEKEFIKKIWRPVAEIVAFLSENDPSATVTAKDVYRKCDQGRYAIDRRSRPYKVSVPSVIRSLLAD